MNFLLRSPLHGYAWLSALPLYGSDLRRSGAVVSRPAGGERRELSEVAAGAAGDGAAGAQAEGGAAGLGKRRCEAAVRRAGEGGRG